MSRAVATLWAGVLAAGGSLLALLANEGVFFDPEPSHVQLNVSGFECETPLAQVSDGEPFIRVGIANQRFLSLEADLVLEVEMSRYADAGCGFFEIKPRRAVSFEDESAHYAFSGFRTTEYGGETQRFEGDYFQRTDFPAEEARRDNVVRAVIPGAFRRVAADAYTVRLASGDFDEALFAEAYGERGMALSDGWDKDVTFQLESFARWSAVISILFASALGIGVGAVFEAILVFATARRLAEFEAEIVGAEGATTDADRERGA